MGQRLGPQRGGGAPATEPATAAGRLRAGCRYAPAAAAGAFVLAQLLLVIPGTGLGWDEIVYVSQVEPGTPTAYFSAPRARGVSWLAAPAAALAGSAAHPAVLRTYLALLSGLGLLIALRAWRGLLPPAVLGCAGLLFARLWITLYYGPRAMPNLWCALGALAATGWFLRAVAPPCRGTPAGHRALLLAGAAVAFVTAMRPGDGAWLTLPLTAAALLIRPWRRAPTVSHQSLLPSPGQSPGHTVAEGAPAHGRFRGISPRHCRTAWSESRGCVRWGRRSTPRGRHRCG
ncbi:hypothetical protein [Streptomyces sp. NBC_00063]|uniref:hypothetical protein n=1 Tax=Streptomyces sp. NBC_00063 TaxID=2975638 RepID=UPI002B1CF139|nr:hypothetical protein [Streptomyces sp. NBC_00063]